MYIAGPCKICYCLLLGECLYSFGLEINSKCGSERSSTNGLQHVSNNSCLLA
jgi:hypothetical protein